MFQGTTSISGLASGFDWRQLVDDLIAVDRRRITHIENQQAVYQQQLAEWQSLNTKLLSLRTSAMELRDPEVFSSFRGSMISNNPAVKAQDLVSPSMTSAATEGTYSLVVDHLAAAQRLASGAQTSASEALGLSGDITINGVVVTLEETDSLADVRTKINSAGADVMASLVSYESDDHRLTLTSRTTGAEGISLGGEQAILDAFEFEELAAGRDAELRIDGVTVTRPTNTIEGVIEGVTLNLLAADEDTTITLSVDRHHGAAEEKIRAFVSSYNAVASYIGNQRAFDEETEKPGGPLFGDGTLATVSSDLSSTILRQVEGVDPDFSRLALVGISLNRDGLLTIDEAVLSENLENNFEDVVSLFSARGSAEGEHLTYVTSGAATRPGTYVVDITQAATRGQAVGEVDLSESEGGLDADVTLAMQLGVSQTTIALTEGMTAPEIVDAINLQLVEAGMAASASVGENNNLVVTHNNYGSASSFIFQRIDGEGDLGIANGLYAGLDVAGTINGEAAVGAGQRLTGASDAPNVAGLAVRYTGEDPMEAGTVTFTAGVAEQFSRTLTGITDPISGYLTFKQESLRSSISTYDDRIERISELLDMRAQRMIDQFIAMEMTLRQVAAQSEWLEGQTQARVMGWQWNRR